jgi:cephalosporin hydroxylase
MRSTQLGAGEIRRAFHVLWYDSRVWEKLTWMGIPIQKNPFDLFQYQELLFGQRPAVVVETGALYGGSTLFFAQILDGVGAGEVISIDVNPRWDFRARDHPRVTTITGSSADAAVVEEVRDRVAGRPVLIVLDSDHSRDHVLRELRLYSRLVQPGGYLIAEDTDVNGHPAAPEHGPGPFEAVEAFLSENEDFESDLSREDRLLFTAAPNGWLCRRAEPPRRD